MRDRHRQSAGPIVFADAGSARAADCSRSRVGNLARKGLVEVVDHDVRLTAAGKHLAEETLSKHRFFERLLANAGVNAEVASKEACRMEHCISTDSFEKLSSHLGRIQDSLR